MSETTAKPNTPPTGRPEGGAPREQGENRYGGDRGGERGGERGEGGRRPPRRFRRRVLDTRNLVIDYKNPETLERFISRTGKLLPRRMTGATAKIQRKIAREIRRARMINLLPFSRR